MLNMKLNRSLKRSMLWVLTFQLIFACMPVYSAESIDPNVHVDITAGIQEVYAGQEARISVPLVTDDKTAVNITVAISSDLDSLPFIFTDTNPWTKVDKITDKGANPYFKPLISPTAKEKVYEIELEIEYESLPGDTYRTTDSVYIRIINDEVEPLVGVVDYRMTQTPLTHDGVNQAVVLTVGNRGTSNAHNIRASLSGFSPEGLHIYKGMDIQAIDEIEANHEQLVYFYLQPSKSTKTDEYELEVTLKYDDDVGAEYTRTSYIYIPVQGNDTKAVELVVNDLVAPDKVNAGDSFEISGVLENKSGVEAEFVDISVDYPDGFIPESKPVQIIRDMKSGQTEPFLFVMTAGEDMQTEHYPINLVIKYNASGDDTERDFKEYAGVSVDGRSGLGRPKILVDDYSFEGDAVMAGEVFDLHLKFFNTSSDDLVKNIKVSVSSEEGVFSPADSSSSFFIERIERQGYYEYVLPIETKRDAAVKTHNLKLVMEYEDGEGNAYDAQEQPFKEEESLGISVSQPVRLETGDVAAPFDAFVGSPSDVELEFYNMGRSDMYNMFVKLEGDFTSQDGTYFVGNFESGSSDYFMASIIPEEEGEVTGNIVFTFEDALGNPSTVERPFSFYASGMSDFDTSFEGDMDQGGDFGDDMMLEDGEGGSKAWGYVVLAVVVLGGGAWFIIRRRKQKAALLLAMEEDDE